PYRVLRTGFYTRSGIPYDLEIRTSTVEEDDFLINLAFSLLVLYIVIALSIMLVNYIVLAKALQPFERILVGLRNYRFGNIRSFTPVNSKVKEFEDLDSHIIHMIDRNEQIFEQQKRFLENASHELQTPLTVTISKLDLLMNDERLGGDSLSKIAEAKQSLLRMVGLNRSLLMLSRIENKQYHYVETVSFNKLVKHLLDDLSDLIQFKNLELELIEKGEFATPYNADLARILISNLLRNAIKYNINEGVLRIQIGNDSIDIGNTSTGEALNPKYIFERFHKGAQNSHSNGLGLSIVKSIDDNYPAVTVSYSYDAYLHVLTIY